MTSRRKFLASLGAGAGLAAVARGRARAAQWDFKSAHTLPLDHPLHRRQVDLWDAVRKETDGRMNVTVYGNSQLGGQTALLSQVRIGAIQFFATIGQVYSDVVPVAAIDSVGFAFSSAKLAWSTLEGPLGDYIGKEFEAKGLYRFKTVWDLGLRQITSSTHPIKVPADLSGFKIRVPPAPIATELFKALGASPTGMDANQIYTALQTKVVDGQETPLSSIEAYKFYEVQKYISITNHMYTGNFVTSNLEVWNAIPHDVQNVIQRNVVKYGHLESQDNDAENNSLVPKLQSQGITFNTADAVAMRAQLGAYYARWRNELGSTAWGMLEAKVGKLS